MEIYITYWRIRVMANNFFSLKTCLCLLHHVRTYVCDDGLDRYYTYVVTVHFTWFLWRYFYLSLVGRVYQQQHVYEMEQSTHLL